VKRCRMCTGRRLRYWRVGPRVVIICEDCKFVEPLEKWDEKVWLVNVKERLN